MLLKAQGDNQFKWVSKKFLQTTGLPKNQANKFGKKHQHKVTSKVATKEQWVPRWALIAQGCFAGRNPIWLPKTKHNAPKPKN